MRATSFRRAVGLALVALALGALPARAQLPVFQGDPVDPSSGKPWVLLPGLPLVHPGPDGVFNTADDVIGGGVVGDVDLVVRSQANGVSGGVIVPPAAGVSAAPLVVAGGEQGGVGTRVPFAVIVSDGSTPPAAGHPLLGPELDGRGALVVAYPDLDGDGVIGPTGLAGTSLELQRQEVLQIVGRRPAFFDHGIASGSIAVSLAAPASAGGLGILLGAAGAMGSVPPLYFEQWIATLLPCMVPLDPSVFYDADGDPTPDGPIEFDIETDELFLPPPNHPVLGTPYAVPLDGSSVTVDLARSVSSTAVGAAFVQAVDPASFVADRARRLLPAVAAGGDRRLVEVADTLQLPDDGPGNGRTLALVVTDLLGNPADPPAGGMSVTVEVGPSVRIVDPDADGDPARETLTFGSAAMRMLTIDDAGAAGDGIGGRVMALVGGRPIATVAAVAGTGGPGSGALTGARARAARGAGPTRGRVSLAAGFTADPLAIDPVDQAVEVTLRNAGGVVYTRTIAAPAFVANASGRSFKFKDATSGIVIRRKRSSPDVHDVRLTAKSLDLGGADLAASSLVATITIGSATFETTLACTSNAPATSTRCGK